jgi:hypothetical protein
MGKHINDPIASDLSAGQLETVLFLCELHVLRAATSKTCIKGEFGIKRSGQAKVVASHTQNRLVLNVFSVSLTRKSTKMHRVGVARDHNGNGLLLQPLY